MSNAVMVVPAGIELPAHLQSADIVAQIAAANAAAAGGIRTGGFPRISIKANKFHIVEGAETTTLMAASATPGQPPLPMMCLEIVIVAANPGLSKSFFPGDYVEGSSEEPACRSANGITPDPDSPAIQHAVCATCPQYQWGSKISKLSGKEIRACDDYKQLAVLPAADLGYKALGLPIKKGSLGNWGKYIVALNDRKFPVFGLVTNVTFDATATGVLQFGFNRFLTSEEAAKVKERSEGSDVRAIVSQTRVIPAVPALPAPATVPALAAPSALPTPLEFARAIAPTSPSIPVPTVGFGAVPVVASTPAAVVPTAPELPKRTRRIRAQMAADGASKNPPAAAVTVDLTGYPPEIVAAIGASGFDSAAGKALIEQFKPKTVVPQAAPVGDDKPQPAGVVPPAVTAAPIGFGGMTVAVPVSAQPSAAVISSAASLKDKLTAILNKQGGQVAG